MTKPLGALHQVAEHLRVEQCLEQVVDQGREAVEVVHHRHSDGKRAHGQPEPVRAAERRVVRVRVSGHPRRRHLVRRPEQSMAVDPDGRRVGRRRGLGDLALEVGPVDPTGPVLGQAVRPFGKTRLDRARRPGQVAGNVEGTRDDARQVGLPRRIVDRLRHREGPGALGQCSQCLVAHDERGLCDVAGAGHGEVPGQEQARCAHAIAAQLTHDRAQVGGVGGVGTDGVRRGRAEHRGERGCRRDGRPVGRLQVAQRHDVAVALGQVARRVDDEEPGRGVGVGDIELGPGGPARAGPRRLSRRSGWSG